MKKLTLIVLCLTGLLLSIQAGPANPKKIVPYGNDESKAVIRLQEDCAPITELPWVQNFDEDAVKTIPGCMYRPSPNGVSATDTFPSIISSTSNAYSQPNSLKFNSNLITFVVTPEFAYDVTDLEISFRLKKENNNNTQGKIVLGVFTDPTDTNTFTPLHTIEPSDREWHLYELDFREYEGDGRYIGFKHHSRYDNRYYFLDDIIIKAYSPCKRPTQLAMVSSGPTEASLSWVENGAAISWDIEYDTAGFTLGEGRFDASTHDGPYITLNQNLLPDTRYDFYVRSNCGTEYGEWSFAGHFMTTQIPATTPYLCDFEDDNENLAWGFANSGKNDWYIGYAVNNTEGGAQSLYISKDGENHQYNSSTSVSWAYRDIYFEPAREYEISFNWKVRGYSDSDYTEDYMRVFIGDPVPVYGGTSSWGIQFPAGAINLKGNEDNYFVNKNSWTTYNGVLDESYSGKTKRIYFLWVNSSGNYYNPPAVIDNFVINSVMCYPPTASVDGATPNTISVSWEPENENDSWWEVACVPAGAAIDPENVTQTDLLSHTFTGLNSGSLYDIYIRTLCIDDSYSEWSAKTTSNTGCEAVSVPWTENFDGLTGTKQLPVCMTKHNPYNGYPASSTNSHSGQYSLNFIANTITYAVTPEFELPVKDLQISFWLKRYGGSSGTFTVGIMTDPNDINTFTPVHVITPLDNDWNYYDFNFSSYTGPGHYIAFKQEAEIANRDYWLDDIEVNEYSVCPRPSHLTVNEIGYQEVNVSWHGNGNSGSWTVVYGEPGFNPDEAADYFTAQDTFLTLSSLTAGTVYEFYVRAHCDEGTGIWSPKGTFTTHLVPFVVPFTCDFEDPAQNDNWGFGNSGINDWYIGDLANNTEGGVNALYVSKDGLVHRYDSLRSCHSWAYCDVYFTPGEEFQLSFDWMGRGEYSYGTSSGPWDYMNIIIGDPVSVTGSSNNFFDFPAGEILRVNSTTDYFLGQEEWTRYSTILSGDYSDQTKRIYFVWRNNSTDGNNPPATIDNLVIKNINCFPPTALTFSEPTTLSIKLTWTPAREADNAWEVVYVPAGTDPEEVIAVEVQENEYVFGDWQAGVIYDVYVRTVCGDGADKSDWSQKVSANILCDAVSTLPWTENFDNFTTGQFPPCMTRPYIHGQNGIGFPSVEGSSGEGHDQILKFNSDTITFAVTPAFIDNIKDLQISFDLKKENPYSGYFYVGVMTDPADSSTFVPVHRINPSDNDWHTYDFHFLNYEGSGSYIAFKQEARIYNRYYFLDNIEVTNVVSCRKPTNLIALEENITDVLVSWSDDGEGTSWHVEYGPEGFTPGTLEPLTATDTVLRITGLDPNTRYDFYVESVCGYIGDRSVAGHFMTKQNPLPVPFALDFEDDEENSNWGFANSGINNWYIDSIGDEPTEQGKVLFVSNDGTHHTYNMNKRGYSWAYRDVYFTPAYGYELSFDWIGKGELDPDGDPADYMQIYIGEPVRVDGDSTSATYTVPGNAVPINPESVFYRQNSWISYEALLDESFSGKTQRFYFLWRNDYALGENPPAAVDNFSIQSITCLPPVVLRVDDISVTTADISWTPVSENDTEWEVIYVESGMPMEQGTKVHASDTALTLPNLTAETYYDIYLRTICGEGDTSEWNGPFTFHTECGPITSLPWSENFDNHPLNSFPTCMYRPLTFDDCPKILDHGSGNMLFFRSQYETFAVTPRFEEDIENLKITFDLEGEGPRAGKFIVGVMSDPNDITTFTAVRTITSPSRDHMYHAHEVRFTQNSGQGQYIAFKHETVESNYYYLLDNIVVSYNEDRDSCPEPTDLRINTNGNSVEVSWTAGGNETSWEIDYKIVDDANFTSATTHTNSYTIPNIVNDTTYYVRVRGICGSDYTSEYIDTLFKIKTIGIDEIDLTNSVAVFPNPASSILKIRSTVPFKTIEILNITGQVIYTNSWTNENMDIDVSSFNSGLYFIRMKGAEGIVNKKFIKD